MPAEVTVTTSVPPDVILMEPATGEYRPVFASLEKVRDGAAEVPPPSASALGGM